MHEQEDEEQEEEESDELTGSETEPMAQTGEQTAPRRLHTSSPELNQILKGETDDEDEVDPQAGKQYVEKSDGLPPSASVSGSLSTPKPSKRLSLQYASSSASYTSRTFSMGNREDQSAAGELASSAERIIKSTSYEITRGSVSLQDLPTRDSKDSIRKRDRINRVKYVAISWLLTWR